MPAGRGRCGRGAVGFECDDAARTRWRPSAFFAVRMRCRIPFAPGGAMRSRRVAASPSRLARCVHPPIIARVVSPMPRQVRPRLVLRAPPVSGRCACASLGGCAAFSLSACRQRLPAQPSGRRRCLQLSARRPPVGRCHRPPAACPSLSEGRHSARPSPQLRLSFPARHLFSGRCCRLPVSCRPPVLWRVRPRLALRSFAGHHRVQAGGRGREIRGVTSARRQRPRDVAVHRLSAPPCLPSVLISVLPAARPRSP